MTYRSHDSKMDLAMGGWWIVCLKCITWLFILTLNQGECLRPLRNEAGLFSSGTPKVRDVSARSIVYKTKYIEQPVSKDRDYNSISTVLYT